MNLVKRGIFTKGKKKRKGKEERRKEKKKEKNAIASQTQCSIKADPVLQQYTSFWDRNLLKFI